MMLYVTMVAGTHITLIARMAMIAFAGLVVHHYLPSAVPGLGTLA